VSTLFFILAAISAVLVVVFGIAAQGELSEGIPPPRNTQEGLDRLLDVVTLGGTLINEQCRLNWRKRPRGRKLAVAAVISLASSLVFAGLSIVCKVSGL
jgi:hypothetical protein